MSVSLMSGEGPTVIVARRAVPGREGEFLEWNTRLTQVARQFEGYVAAEVQPPDDVHPGEWMNIYRFRRQVDLDRWLESPERATVMREGLDLVDGPTREQRIARADPDAEVVTAVMSKRIRSDATREYEVAHDEITVAMGKFPGFVGCDVHPPVAGIQDEHITVFSFDNRRHLDDWLGSDERAAVLARIEPLLDGESTMNVVGGFAGWFEPDDSPTPVRWKQSVAVLVALFPTVVVLTLVQRQVFEDVPWVLALLVSNVVSVSLLTWVLMPVVTRVLGGWLTR